MNTTPTCPICNQPPTDVARRDRDGIAHAYFICASEHLWETKWVLPAPPDASANAS